MPLFLFLISHLLLYQPILFQSTSRIWLLFSPLSVLHSDLSMPLPSFSALLPYFITVLLATTVAPKIVVRVVFLQCYLDHARPCFRTIQWHQSPELYDVTPSCPSEPIFHSLFFTLSTLTHQVLNCSWNSPGIHLFLYLAFHLPETIFSQRSPLTTTRLFHHQSLPRMP